MIRTFRISSLLPQRRYRASSLLSSIFVVNRFFPNDEEHRHELAYSKGGKICGDKSQVNKIRSIGKEMIKIVGKKIISGDLNLTRISFPIKAMVSRTALVNSTVSCCMNPYYMKRALEAKDPLERLKFVMTNTISAFYYISMFVKPVIMTLFSSTLSLEKPCRDHSLMGLRFTASRSRIILLSVISWLLDLKEDIVTTETTTSRHMLV